MIEPITIELPHPYTASLAKRVIGEVCEALGTQLVCNETTDHIGPGLEIGQAAQSAHRHLRVVPSDQDNLFRDGSQYPYLIVRRWRWDVAVSPVGYREENIADALKEFADTLRDRTR